jgi:hypothetical protein
MFTMFMCFVSGNEVVDFYSFICGYILLNVIPTYEVLSESSRTVIVVTASVKEDEKGGQGHTSVCHVTPRCEQALFLHR